MLSSQLLLGMGVTACAQAGFSHPSPVSQFKESTLRWKTEKGHLFSVTTLEDVLERIVTKCLCPTPRDLEKVLVRGNLWTKARTRKEHQLDPGKPEDREPRGCVRKEGRQ